MFKYFIFSVYCSKCSNISHSQYIVVNVQIFYSKHSKNYNELEELSSTENELVIKRYELQEEEEEEENDDDDDDFEVSESSEWDSG